MAVGGTCPSVFRVGAGDWSVMVQWQRRRAPRLAVVLGGGRWEGRRREDEWSGEGGKRVKEREEGGWDGGREGGREGGGRENGSG